jgi:molybdenum cofactor cytidylyltransferase
MSNKKLFCLILSAGLSGRMKMFKPLANYKGKTFIHNIILMLNPVCEKIFVVTGFNSEKLKEEVTKTFSKNEELLSKLNFVHNENYEQGMFTSLQKGINAASDCDWILYHFVDQPGMPDNFYREFVKQIDSEHNWIQPSYNNRHGHPILLGKDLFELIIKSSPDASLRDINKNPLVKRKFWECDYKEIFQDIDTKIDLEELK